MFKKAMLFILALVLLVPSVSFAAEYQTMTLKEALAQEQIESKLKDYTESDEKATVYLFRGNGCGFCRGFLTYLNDHIDELGKYFNLVSYEVWENADNAELMQKVGNFTGVAAQGVPYIVVGDKVFDGFTEEAYGEDFSAAVKALYESEDRYDVLEEMAKAEKKAQKEATGSTTKIIVWDAVFSAITIGAVATMFHFNNKKLEEKFTKFEKKSNKKK